METAPTTLIFLIGLLATAVYSDLRYRVVPNALTFGGTLAALVLSLQSVEPLVALALSGSGMVLGLLLFLPSYALGKMGAGDVKLLAMVGAFVGPEGVFWTMVWSLITGGAIALAWLAVGLCLRHLSNAVLGTFAADRLRVGPGGGAAAERSPMQTKMPFALAIALGTLIAASVPPG